VETLSIPKNKHITLDLILHPLNSTEC